MPAGSQDDGVGDRGERRIRHRIAAAVRGLEPQWRSLALAYGAAPQRRLLWTWASVPVGQAVLGAWDPVRPSGAQWLLEVAAWWCGGLLHARAAPPDWRGSPGWPLLAWVAAIALRVWLPNGGASTWLLGAVLVAAAFAAVQALDRALRRTPVWALVLVTALSARLVAVGPPDLARAVTAYATPRPAAAPGGPPLVVITVDTLRSDAAEGMESARFLAQRGSRFPRAMAAASWTVPSLATLWTGEPAAVHGAGRRPEGGFTGLRSQVPTLAEQLGAAGYVTTAFVTNPFLAAGGNGLDRGFDRYVYIDRSTTQPLAIAGWPVRGNRTGDARRVVDATLDWLRGAPDSGFLLWVHLSEPHLPYEHHADPERYSAKLVAEVRAGHRWYVDVPALRSAYDAEVAYADAEIMRLLRALDARGHFAKGAVILTSDHGEELLEHGGIEHGHSHHGEVLDVPLLVAAPGASVGLRPELASLADVAPTLRSVAGLPSQGVDLRDAIPAARIATADGNLYYRPERSVRTGELRMLQRNRGPLIVFDLATDPGEQRPRPASSAEDDLFASAWIEPPALLDAPRLDPDEARLRALGYVH